MGWQFLPVHLSDIFFYKVTENLKSRSVVTIKLEYTDNWILCPQGRIIIVMPLCSFSSSLRDQKLRSFWQWSVILLTLRNLVFFSLYKRSGMLIEFWKTNFVRSVFDVGSQRFSTCPTSLKKIKDINTLKF